MGCGLAGAEPDYTYYMVHGVTTTTAVTTTTTEAQFPDEAKPPASVSISRLCVTQLCT